MRIIQLLPTMAYGDAVGNDTLAIGEALKEAGYETAIYAENIDKRLPKKAVLPIEKYKEKEGDLVIFHLSIYSKMNELVKKLKSKVVIIYHNVTPPEFFDGYSSEAKALCEKGLHGVEALKDVPELVIADSEFNKQDLIRMGYKCPIEVVPIVIAFDDYKKEPDQSVIKKYEGDGWTNLLFTGRIAPNKKQEDVIKAFYYYKNYFNPKSRLFIVGSYAATDLYYNKLVKYVEELGLDDVIFPGHIPFDQILAYYNVADVFVCMSEHEGFCVPLVEAMFFDVPIVAYDSTAIGETLGGSALLLDDKNPMIVAGAIDKIVKDDNINRQIKENQRARLSDFDRTGVKNMMIDVLEGCL